MSDVKTLIIDECSLLLNVIENLLQACGITRITKSGSRQRALEEFDGALREGSPFTLVFVDVRMRDLHGIETLREMRALERDFGVGEGAKATIIVVTSLRDPQDMTEALWEGDGTDYLVKPFNLEELRGILWRNGIGVPKVVRRRA